MTPLLRTDGLSLEIERVLPAPRGAVWRCWTEPELLMRWHCPKPWRVSAADLDLRPGGRMNMTMEGPEGRKVESEGMVLEVEPGRRLTFTDGYREGFIPAENSFMTGFVRLEDAEDGATRMIWGARHRNEAEKQKHLEMGFETGWSAAVEQLATLAPEVAAQPGGAAIAAAKLRPCLWLAGDVEEAVRLYVSLLPDSAVNALSPPGSGAPVQIAEFTLAGVAYWAMSGNANPISSDMTSISVMTEDQAETDRLWTALTADGGEAGRCGWLKDRFGLHWQITPNALPRLLGARDPEAAARAHAAMMTMSKIDIAALEAAAAHP